MIPVAMMRIETPRVGTLPQRPAAKPQKSMAKTIGMLRPSWSAPPAPIPPSVSGKLSERASSISTTGTTTEQQAYPVKQLKAA